MKRKGNLWNQVTSWENLTEAARVAARGKRKRPDVARFLHELEPNLCRLQRELEEGNYRPGAYRTFWIRDPKPRQISAASFRDRVVSNVMDELAVDERTDALVRRVSQDLNSTNGVEAVPICKTDLPPVLHDGDHALQPASQTVLKITVEKLPMPSEDCPWQDILDFKSETREKQWGFRRFIGAVATKNLRETEIHDEIEWMLNEYRKAMEIHHLKASLSFVDVFIISPLEIIENLVKFNWSKIAKGALQVQRRKVELMEAEMKAPGRECAYVFDAQKRFGRSG